MTAKKENIPTIKRSAKKSSVKKSTKRASKKSSVKKSTKRASKKSSVQKKSKSSPKEEKDISDEKLYQDFLESLKSDNPFKP
jgi:hypothetical protein